MRKELFAAMMVVATFAPMKWSAAQSTPVSAQERSLGDALEKLVTRPNPIALDKPQRLFIDSVKIEYVTEVSKLEKDSKAGENPMESMQKMSAVSSRYQVLVRKVLKPEQQVLFDKNLEAASVRR